MEHWSSSLSIGARHYDWNSALEKSPVSRIVSYFEEIDAIADAFFGKRIRSCKLRIASFQKLLPPVPFKRLIFEAIEQCQVKDGKAVVLSEEFFMSIWPIVVSAVVLLSFVYLYYINYIDRGGSKSGSSGSLDFRDIYISIVLFQAAYVWIKFRDVSSEEGIYFRETSQKWEPRILFPKNKGVGGKLKRIPLRSYDAKANAKVVRRIAAFYCNKRQHTGRLDLGGGVSFPIPALNVDPDLPYEQQVKQIGDQVLRVYAEFEDQKASRNVPPPGPTHVLGQALETSTGEGCELLTTSRAQQPEEPLTSGMDSAMQGQGSQPAPGNIHNKVDFNNLDSLRLVLLQTQHELLETKKEKESLRAELSRTKVENKKLEQRNSELECEKGLLNQQIVQLQSQPPPLDLELAFDDDSLFNMIQA